MDFSTCRKHFFKWGIYTRVFLLSVSWWLQETPWRNQCLEHTGKELAQDCQSRGHWLPGDCPRRTGKGKSHGAATWPFIL